LTDKLFENAFETTGNHS